MIPLVTKETIEVIEEGKNFQIIRCPNCQGLIDSRNEKAFKLVLNKDSKEPMVQCTCGQQIPLIILFELSDDKGEEEVKTDATG